MGMKVLNGNTADLLLSKIHPLDLEWCNSFRIRLHQVMMALGRPTRVRLINEKSFHYSWVIQLNAGMHLIIINAYTDINIDQDKFSSNLTNMIMSEDYDIHNIHIWTYNIPVDILPFKSTIEHSVKLRPAITYSTKDFIKHLINCQFECIKNGTMEYEWFMLGDVETYIEPIDKKAWIEDNRYILDKIKEIYETNKGMADASFNYNLET